MRHLVKAAVIGPELIVSKVMEIGNAYNGLLLIPVPYGNEKEAIPKSMDADEKVDIIMYTGPVPYILVSEIKEELTSLLMYINYNGTGLYKVLFQMIRDGVIKQELENRISLDSLNREEVIQTFAELEMNDQNVHILQYTPGMNSERITEFHYNLWKKRSVDVAVTCLYSVYENLQNKGIPCYCIVPTRAAIQSSLDMVLAWGRNKINESKQIAVCMVNVEDCTDGEIIQMISDSLQTAEQKIDSQCSIFYTTKGMVHSLTEGFKKIPDFMIRSGVGVGVGVGQTAKEALLRSQIALSKGEEEDRQAVYIVGDINTVIKIPHITPIPRLEYQSRSYDEPVLKTALSTNLSVSTLSKIRYIAKASGSEDITSIELSHQLNITLRSARRILKALKDNGYAEIVGEEHPIERGRPRQIYRLSLAHF